MGCSLDIIIKALRKDRIYLLGNNKTKEEGYDVKLIYQGGYCLQATNFKDNQTYIIYIKDYKGTWRLIEGEKDGLV